MVKIIVHVVANSAKSEVIMISDNEFKVKVDKVPEKGKANKRLIEILSDYFNISKKDIEILHGQTSSKKLVEIKNV
ncbi:DUF167 domain-containing protein [Candidatus Pacearchaeota archaeon]|nr:DUF167 domain-containing protein [Candidatus Pacearchaeota archaeon]